MFLSQDPPKQPYCIQLQFDEIDTIIDLYHEILRIFTYGMKRFYGNENGTVSLHLMTEKKNKCYKTIFT